MLLPALTVTRDLIHFRKLPPGQTALHTLASTFLTLLSSPSSAQPVSSALRQAFLPALLGTDARPRDAGLLQRADEQLRGMFEQPPSVCLVQTVPGVEQVDQAWRASEGEGAGSGGGGMRDKIFVAFALNQELERAKEEDEREEVANLSMMVIATLAYELAHWICVKTRGYHSPLDPLLSDSASLRSSLTATSLAPSTSSSSAFSSTSTSNAPLTPPRHPRDAGLKAVLALLGVDYELLTFSIGTRQLVKRRYPTRRSPTLTPPVVYALIGDTPAIVDATAWPVTRTGTVPPQYGDDSMYVVTAVLTPAGQGKMHGECLVSEAGGGGAASSAGSGSGSGANGSKVQVDVGRPEGALGREEEEGEKMVDRMYSGL
ncbi:hypothetical protein JCM11251_007692 [Rhodosporidiobolus azoricus]